MDTITIPARDGRTAPPARENADPRHDDAAGDEAAAPGGQRTEKQHDHTAITVHPYSAVDRWRAPDDFAAAIVNAGLGSPGAIIADGRVHRFQAEGDTPGTRNGWYSLHLDGIAAGIFGSWKWSEPQTWCSVSRDQMTPAQSADLRRMVETAKAKRQAEAAARHAKAAEAAAALWERAKPARPAHPYLVAKGIEPHGTRQDGPRLVVPVYIDGQLASVQTIDPSRTPSKLFMKAGKTAGGCFMIETAVTRPEVLLCEGFATGATLHEQTGARTYCAFAAGNLLAVARAVRALHPRETIIVCADNDAWTDANPGVAKASEAAIAIGARLLVPDFTGLDLTSKPTDFNDLVRLTGSLPARLLDTGTDHGEPPPPDPDDPGPDDHDTGASETHSLNDVHHVHHVHHDPEATTAAAVESCRAAVAGSAEDPAVLVNDEFNAAARLLREEAPDEWARLRGPIKDAARAAGLKMGEIDRKTRPDSGPADDSTIADDLVALVQDCADLFHAPDGTCYATLTGTGPILTFRLDTQAFADWLSFRFYSDAKANTGQGRAASDTAIRTARVTLTGIARHEGDERPVYLRAAQHEGSYYIDLGSELLGAIAVSATGWRMVTRPPVNFWRPSTMRPMPLPVHGGNLSLLWQYANIPEPARPLVLSWMLDAWRPETPFAVLELTGQQGTAKSSTQAKLRRCIDPNAVDLRSAAKSVEDLFVSAGANWVASLNNLSHLSAPMQDALCNLATGGGFAGRTLYTNADETLIEAKRPVMLNGIVPAVTAQDLTDRVIHIDLPELGSYRTETAIDADFERDAPQIIGGLLDLFVETLAALPAVNLPKSPRMADYAALGEALMRAQGKDAGEFLKLYQDNRADSVARSLEASPVACAVRRLVEDHPKSSIAPAWDETMGKLLDYLGRYRDGADAWPKSARGLGEALRRQRPALSQIGISVDIGKAGKHGVPVTIRARPTGEHGEHGERRSDCGSLTRVCDPADDTAEVF